MISLQHTRQQNREGGGSTRCWKIGSNHINMARGALIVLEGLDKSGKTTQIKNCLEILRADGFDVCQLSFPDRNTSTGQLINSFLREHTVVDDRTVHLLFSANRWEKW